MATLSSSGDATTWIRYPESAIAEKLMRDVQPLRRLAGLGERIFWSVCDRNSIPKKAMKTGAAIRCTVSVAGSHGWLTTANGSSVSSRCFIQK